MPYKDHTKQLAAIDKFRRRNQQYVRDAKSKPCTDCNIQYPYYVMQFDHVRGTKLYTLTSFQRTTRAIEIVDAEIAKCDVVCANCHAVRTWNRTQEKRALKH